MRNSLSFPLDYNIIHVICLSGKTRWLKYHDFTSTVAIWLLWWLFTGPNHKILHPSLYDILVSRSNVSLSFLPFFSHLL